MALLNSISVNPICDSQARPVLRWAGSKRLMLPKLMEWAPVSYRRYIEPFCGSACYFLALNPQTSVLADLNRHLISTYKEIRNSPQKVANAMAHWSADKEGYLDARRASLTDPLKAAGRFLFLNRYSFNGVYRENLRGEFNVPFGGQRNGRLPSLEDLHGFAHALANTELICSDFERVIDKARKDDFLYLDPPYHYGSARNRGEYGCGAFSDEDLERFLASVLRASDRGAKVLISYNKAHVLQKKLRGWKLGYCTVRRSVAGFSQSRREIREYLLRNY